jgi:hypothetical protein
MLVFLDFEASSLGKRGYPIEVAWVFEDGREEAHLIKPAPGWQDWEPAAEAIHGIARATLEAEGTAHDIVAGRMVDVLTGHDLLASAPSWDGKWLSILLRAAGLPRHSLRLRDTEDAQREVVEHALAGIASTAECRRIRDELMTASEIIRRTETPKHRALADAEGERERWLALREAAKARATFLSASGS